LFARWDGAEFIALFRDRGAGETAAIIDQALAMLRRLEFRTGGDTPLTVTFSAGVVDVDPPRSMDDTIELADRLRYLAKASGRNRVASGGARLESSPARILLAEDDPDIVRVLTTHLGREGFEILACADGRQALREAPGCGASLIISDIEMPELDGLEFLKAIRSHPELRHLPVMMLTAMGDEAVIVRAFELGADDYVLKPFSLRELAARLRRLLRRPCLAGVPAA
jgi:PleD family two-component response regulator